MAHGKVHQNNQTDGRTDDPFLHLLHGVFLLICFLFLCHLLFTGNKSTVASLGDRLDDGGSYIFRSLHLHGARQQIHFRFFYTGNGFGYLLHTGRAGGAGHTGYVEFEFHVQPSFP